MAHLSKALGGTASSVMGLAGIGDLGGLGVGHGEDDRVLVGSAGGHLPGAELLAALAVTALGLALLAVYCAYFLPLGRMLFQVVWMIGLFVALTVASPQLDSPLYTAIVVVTQLMNRDDSGVG